MPHTFQVTILSCRLVEEIEGGWTDADFARLLEALDYGDTAGMSAGDLREMCVCSLQDLPLDEAAAMLLGHKLEGALTKGKLKTLSREMEVEKHWEHHADMSVHERLFHVGSLLHQAFPGQVPVPDAVEATFEVTARDAKGERLLAAPLHESFLVRLLAHGMPDSAMLNRLFDEAVAGKAFPEAESIVWIAECEAVDAKTIRVRVFGSAHWLAAVQDADESYESTAWPDKSRA
jgi:hypothetical protein